MGMIPGGPPKNYWRIKNLNYKQIRTGQDKVNSQEEIETFLDRSKSKV